MMTKPVALIILAAFLLAQARPSSCFIDILMKEIARQRAQFILQQYPDLLQELNNGQGQQQPFGMNQQQLPSNNNGFQQTNNLPQQQPNNNNGMMNQLPYVNNGGQPTSANNNPNGIATNGQQQQQRPSPPVQVNGQPKDELVRVDSTNGTSRQS